MAKLRRLNKPEKPEAPQQETDVTETEETTEERQLPQLAEVAALQQYGAFERHDSLQRAMGARVPWIGFVSNRSESIQDIRRDLGGVNEGTPFVCIDDRYVAVDALSYVILDEFPHWIVLQKKDGRWGPTHAWLEPQEWGAKIGDKKVSEQVLAQVLLLPGKQPLPDEFQPALATLTTFRSTKTGAARRHLDAVERSMDAEWAKANPDLAASAPPRFRIASTFKVTAKTGGDGHAYSLANAVPQPASLAQLRAIGEWIKGKQCQEDMQAVSERFENQKKELIELASKTTEKPVAPPKRR